MTDAVAQLKEAIDMNELDRVRTLMTGHPELHRAPLGYGKDGPLTWVAECRVPWEAPGPARLAIARWMIENGSDVHQGGDAPLMRAALAGDRVPMMELLVSQGANVNAAWHGTYPIVHAACETLDPASLKWLLRHGADPNPSSGTALDYAIGSYIRDLERLRSCIEILLESGGKTKHNIPAVLALLRGRIDDVTTELDSNPELIGRRFEELNFGTTGGRMLTLQGATLLHVATEYGDVEAARWLLDRGADVNARATINEAGIGGHTAIFHSATQFGDHGLALTKLLIDRGADLSIQAKLPGHYERPGEVVNGTPLEYAGLFPGRDSATLALLRQATAS